jgi:hypothetical protein
VIIIPPLFTRLDDQICGIAKKTEQVRAFKQRFPHLEQDCDGAFHDGIMRKVHYSAVSTELDKKLILGVDTSVIGTTIDLYCLESATTQYR